MIPGKKITSTMHKLRNIEHVGFGEEAVEKIKAEAVRIATVKPDWDKYEAAVSYEGIMFKQSPEAPETKDIATFDAGRDKYWREMLHRLKFQPDDMAENVRKAADFLLHIMNTYGNVTENNLFAETIAIRRVLQEFKKPEALAAIALIDGFAKLVASITTLNDQLHDLHDQRRIEKEKIKDLGKLVDYRKVVDQYLIAFIDSVNAADIVNERSAKDPSIKAAVEKIRLELNSLISELEKILSHRKQGSKNDGPDGPGEGGGGESGGGEGGGDGGGEGGDGFETPDITNPPPDPFE